MKLWIDPLNKADNVVLVNHFFCPPFPPSNVESTENNLNARHQHCVRGRGREEIRHFYGFIAFMSQEFWPGLSENPFGRKLSFKLYETWYFWGVKLGYINYIVFVYPTLARPLKTYVAEIWSWIKTRHFWPLLTGLCFWLKRGSSTASTPAWWMLGGGFTTFGIKYRRRSSRSWFYGLAALPSASERATATSAWQVGSSGAFIWPRIISRLHFSLTFLTKVKRFSNVFCEVDIAIVVQKSHCPLILC